MRVWPVLNLFTSQKDMFRFADPFYLYMLAAIPLLVAIYALTVWADRRRRRRVADAALWEVLAASASAPRRHLKMGLCIAALAMILLVLARPQFGTSQNRTDKKGIEVVFAMDVSNSMLADDVLPNRLDRAKLLVSSLIDNVTNNKVALCVFAGEAYPQMPITNDYAAAHMFLDNMQPGMVTLQGTNMAAAIRLADKSFTDNPDVGKAIVLITDSEDHEEGAIEAAEEARRNGRQVYVLGVGTADGGTIRMPDGSLLTDENGQVVRTTINENMARQIAEAGGGKYFRVDNSDTAGQQLMVHLDNLKQADTSSSFDEPGEQFVGVALIALVLLVAEYIIREVKNRIIKRLQIVKK